MEWFVYNASEGRNTQDFGIFSFLYLSDHFFLQKNLFDSIMISGARIVELDLSDNAIGYNNRLTVILIIYTYYGCLFYDC